MSFDGFSLAPLARELNAALQGGRLDRINQPNKQSIVLGVRQPGENFWLNISVNSQNPAAYLIKKAPENPPEPPLFCMVLRKHLETGRIVGLRQEGLDRLFFLDVDTLAAGGRIVTKTLALEFMGKYSNIILLEEGRIIDALKKIGKNNSRVRTVLPGDTYEFPPRQDKLNIFTDSLAAVTDRLKARPEAKLSQALLDVCLGFGPPSAKETAWLSGLPGDLPVGNMAPSDWASLTEALEEMRRRGEGQDHGSLVLGANKKILAMAAFPLHYAAGEVRSYDNLSRLLATADDLLGSYIPPDRERLEKLVKNESARAANKIKKLQAELAAAENAEEYKVRADNLMTYAPQYQDHADAAITVPNIYSDCGEPLVIPLDRKLTLMQNMRAAYKKYDKLKRSKALIQEQIAKSQGELTYLASIAASLQTAVTLADTDEIHGELVAGGYLKEKPRKKNKDKPAKPLKITLPTEGEVFIGKNNYQNDRLTFKEARPTDLWLHAKDIPGSHVILRVEGEPKEETLLLAAKLAAYFSQAQGSGNVPVDYVPCRYVKKPHGSKPGFVIFTKQRTVYVTPDKEELRPLLMRSEGGGEFV